jgi:hypothetical protein
MCYDNSMGWLEATLVGANLRFQIGKHYFTFLHYFFFPFFLFSFFPFFLCFCTLCHVCNVSK